MINKLKKIVLLIFLTMFSIYGKANTLKISEINSESYIVVEYLTGDVLIEKDANKKLPPASLTKIMTAYVVFKELKKGTLKLDDKVKISEKAWKTKGSRTFLEVNSYVKIEDLIKGLIIQSGNDAAVALAEHISGSEKDFSTLMNYYAQELGMKNTNFKNASGLPSENHYSSAYDLSLLTSSLIKEFPDYYNIYSFEQFTYNDITQKSRNRLLDKNSDFDGVKTGFTNNAGYCFVGSARRGDRRLISVVLNSKTPQDRFEDTKKLMNNAFLYYELHNLFERNEYIPQLTTNVYKGNKNYLRVGVEEDILLSLKKNSFDNIKFKIDIYEKVIAPVNEGDFVGKIKIINNLEEVLVEKNLVALDTVKQGSFFKRTLDFFKLKSNGDI